jgi:hypothetical protein
MGATGDGLPAATGGGGGTGATGSLKLDTRRALPFVTQPSNYLSNNSKNISCSWQMKLLTPQNCLNLVPKMNRITNDLLELLRCITYRQAKRQR